MGMIGFCKSSTIGDDVFWHILKEDAAKFKKMGYPVKEYKKESCIATILDMFTSIYKRLLKDGVKGLDYLVFSTEDVATLHFQANLFLGELLQKKPTIDVALLKQTAAVLLSLNEYYQPNTFEFTKQLFSTNEKHIKDAM
jgi:hypothetical protein